MTEENEELRAAKALLQRTFDELTKVRDRVGDLEARLEKAIALLGDLDGLAQQDISQYEYHPLSGRVEAFYEEISS